MSDPEFAEAGVRWSAAVDESEACIVMRCGQQERRVLVEQPILSGPQVGLETRRVALEALCEDWARRGIENLIVSSLDELENPLSIHTGFDQRMQTEVISALFSLAPMATKSVVRRALTRARRTAEPNWVDDHFILLQLAYKILKVFASPDDALEFFERSGSRRFLNLLVSTSPQVVRDLLDHLPENVAAEMRLALRDEAGPTKVVLVGVLKATAERARLASELHGLEPVEERRAEFRTAAVTARGVDLELWEYLGPVLLPIYLMDVLPRCNPGVLVMVQGRTPFPIAIRIYLYQVRQYYPSLPCVLVTPHEVLRETLAGDPNLVVLVNAGREEVFDAIVSFAR